MTELTDERIKEIAKNIAHENKVSVADVLTSRTLDSAGASAIEVKLVLTPGSTSAVTALPWRCEEQRDDQRAGRTA